MFKNALPFVSGKDNRQLSLIICSDRIEFVFTKLFIENQFINKNECVQCLVLGVSRNLALYREIAEVFLVLLIEKRFCVIKIKELKAAGNPAHIPDYSLFVQSLF